jgi:tRNA(Ile)-lysidine synthase
VAEAQRAFRAVQIEGTRAMDAASLGALARPLRRRILAAFLVDAGFAVSADRIDGADAAVSRGARESLSRTAWLDARGSRVRIARKGQTHAIEAVPLDGAWREIPAAGLAFRVGEDVPDAESSLQARVADDSMAPFAVRFRAPGDRVRSGAHSRKLQDLLVDLRVPAEIRDSLPLVTQSDGRVIWIPGVWAAPSQGARCVHARLLPGGQAPEWLVRYRLLK